jgi:hypothetical protein
MPNYGVMTLGALALKNPSKADKYVKKIHKLPVYRGKIVGSAGSAGSSNPALNAFLNSSTPFVNPLSLNDLGTAASNVIDKVVDAPKDILSWLVKSLKPLLFPILIVFALGITFMIVSKKK